MRADSGGQVGPEPFDEFIRRDGPLAVGDEDFEQLAGFAARPGRGRQGLVIDPDPEGTQELDPQPLYDVVSSLPNASVFGAPIERWFREAIKFCQNQCRGSPYAGSHLGREVLTEIQHVLGFHRRHHPPPHAVIAQNRVAKTEYQGGRRTNDEG